MAATITVNENGSYKVTGDFTLVDREGNVYGLDGRDTIFLCRCGESGNKPFCDGKHKSCGFLDPGTARELAPKQ